MTVNRSEGEWNLAVRQQAALAHVGQLGLRAGDLEGLLREAMVTTADVLGVIDAGLFELRDDPREPGELRGRAGLLDGHLAGRRTVGQIALAVDATSLPGYAVLEGTTVLTDDLHTDPRFQARAAQFSFPGRAAVAAPIGWDEELIGVLVVYDRVTRTWTDDEAHFVQAIANTMGLAILRSRIEADLRDSRARLDLSLSAGGLGAWSWELERDEVRLNRSAVAMYGVDADGFSGSGEKFLALLHPEDRRRFRADLIRSVELGHEQHHTVRVIRHDNSELRWIEIWGRQLHTEISGFHLVGVCSDITDRHLVEQEQQELLAREHAARVEAEVTRERLSFLAEASAVLSSSLVLDDTLQSLADLCVPYLADVCLIDLMDDDDQLVESAARAVDAQSLADVQELRRRRAALGGVGGVYSERKVAREGRAIMHTLLDDDDYRRASVDEEHLAAFRRFGGHSAVVAPLIGRAGVLGVVSLQQNRKGRAFTAEDLALVEELAARAALAVDNARLYESRNRVARSLQAALLPPALPEIAGLSMAARYDVAEADVAIGGDFYDVIALGTDGWGVVVGDVCGRGPDAAALTGLVRHTLRTAVVREHQPSRVLRQTNQAILQQIDDASFCTVAYLHVEVADASEGRVRVVASSAGHPRPILVRADGTVRSLECSGTLLGVVEAPTLIDVSVDLGAGDAIVLYTDGITEARRGDELFGEKRLRRTLEPLAGATAEEIAAGLDAAVAEFRRSSRDDTAILVVQASPSA